MAVDGAVFDYIDPRTENRLLLGASRSHMTDSVTVF